MSTPKVLGDIPDGVNFNDQGLVPAIVQDVTSNAVLMLAWMNRESIERTLSEGRVTYFSRSRQELWRKGDTSGNVQWATSVALDCDGDTLLIRVDHTRPACHTGAATCFEGSDQ
jgi:Phosphoribosyl-AMP cyclohydrolase